MSDRFSQLFINRIEKRLTFLYGSEGPALSRALLDKLSAFAPVASSPPEGLWTQQDALLITYGDSIRGTDEVPLKTLHRFLHDHLLSSFSSIHILPYFPYSSDDGFAVIDYFRVNPDLGDWPHIESIALDFKLMSDLVINHVSSHHKWVRNFIKDLEPGRDYFIEVDPATDLSKVVRPRTTPLLTPFNTVMGTRWLWTTFSADQVDANFHNPKVLFEYLDILFCYLAKGSRLIRLDAIAYLWKEIGTSCIHLPQTHAIVKLIRDMVDQAVPGTLLISETNVPHEENISYFGEGDEAHVVYQFPLPPLVLHALYQGDASYLTAWAGNLAPPPSGCTFLNFLASHDGIGLRPLEGLLPPQEIFELLEGLQSLDGRVSMRTHQDGSQSPYELNITWFSAMGGTRHGRDNLAIDRHHCAHAIMMALQGIPAFYILSLLGTENDLEGVQRSGAARAINRHKWSRDELHRRLKQPDSIQARVFQQLCQLIELRSHQSAFHPDVSQTIHDFGPAVFSVERSGEVQTLLAIHNVTSDKQSVTLPSGQWYDLITERDVFANLILPPYGVAWLSKK